MRLSLTLDEFARLLVELDLDARATTIASRSRPGVNYTIRQRQETKLHCNCLGYRYKKRCWHVDKLLTEGGIVGVVSKVAYMNRKSRKEALRLLHAWADSKRVAVEAAVEAAFQESIALAGVESAEEFLNSDN